MENRKNNNWIQGFSATEFLTIIVIATILIAIVLTMAFEVLEKERYKVMKYNATLLSYNAAAYHHNNDTSKVYLKQLVDKDLFVNIKNPFDKRKYCDNYTSNVLFEKEKKYVTLSCGSYLIDKTLFPTDEITIYKVSNWKTTEIKGSNVEKKVLYNYIKNDKKVLQQPYEEGAFLLLFNQFNNTAYQTINEIPSKYNIVKDVYYRTKKIVYE